MHFHGSFFRMIMMVFILQIRIPLHFENIYACLWQSNTKLMRNFLIIQWPHLCSSTTKIYQMRLTSHLETWKYFHFLASRDHLSNMLMYHGCCRYTKKMMLSGQIPALPIPIQPIKLLRGLTMTHLLCEQLQGQCQLCM
jgi:hypothetical protein